MAIKLDQSLLEELGLGSLPESEKRALLNHIYETLEMRVGMRLADQMTNEQLDEFERYFEAKDDNGAFHWLETNFPNYKEIVQEEFNKLKNEVKQSSPQILQASQPGQIDSSQPAQPMQAIQPTPPQPDPYAQSQPMPGPSQAQPMPPTPMDSPATPPFQGQPPADNGQMPPSPPQFTPPPQPPAGGYPAS